MAQNANILSILQDGGCLSQPTGDFSTNAAAEEVDASTVDRSTQAAKAIGDFNVLIKALIYFAN